MPKKVCREKTGQFKKCAVPKAAPKKRVPTAAQLENLKAGRAKLAAMRAAGVKPSGKKSRIIDQEGPGVRRANKMLREAYAGDLPESREQLPGAAASGPAISKMFEMS